MTRPEKVVAARDTGLSDFYIMTLGLNLVSAQILGAVPERSGTVNKSVNGAPQRSWAPGRRYDTPREGSGSPGYRPFRLLHYDTGFGPTRSVSGECVPSLRYIGVHFGLCLNALQKLTLQRAYGAWHNARLCRVAVHRAQRAYSAVAARRGQYDIT